jgi:hypothetical protein
VRKLTHKLDVGRDKISSWPSDKLVVNSEHSSLFYDIMTDQFVDQVRIPFSPPLPPLPQLLHPLPRPKPNFTFRPASGIIGEEFFSIFRIVHHRYPVLDCLCDTTSYWSNYIAGVRYPIPGGPLFHPGGIALLPLLFCLNFMASPLNAERFPNPDQVFHILLLSPLPVFRIG